MTADERIAEDDPRRPDVRALLERHREFALAQTRRSIASRVQAVGSYQPSEDNVFMTLDLDEVR